MDTLRHESRWGRAVTASGPRFGTGRPRRPTIRATSSRRRWRTRSATKVEAAYARSDLFERRRLLMNDWEAYLAGERRREDSTPR